MKKKILHVDMDGVIADFKGGILKIDPSIEYSPNSNKDRIDEICEANPTIFHTLDPIDGSIRAVKHLMNYFDVYFLSTPMWNVPESFAGKRIWLETHFGHLAEKKLILTHRKDLVFGHFLIDDTKNNGVDEFKGFHIHYGQTPYNDWDSVMAFIMTHIHQ